MAAGKTVVHFDCFAGISGDMAIAALLDAGAPLEAIEEALATVPVARPRLEVERAARGGVAGTLVRVVETERATRHRTYAELRDLVGRAKLPARAMKRAQRVLYLLAKAESKVHGVPIEEVHFHELGAIDTLVDVVGVAALLEALDVATVTASPVPAGSGTVTTEHGVLPVPAPATAELLAGVPLADRAVEGEAVTPTGAAILAGLASSFGHPAHFAIERIGYGLGHREANVPNFLRALVGVPTRPEETIYEVRTNVDDVNPKLIPETIKRLLTAGALDAWAESVLMKKGRPGFVVSFLAPVGRLDELVEVVFHNLPTIGVRYAEVSRRVLPREQVRVETSLGEVTVKVAETPGGKSVVPEFDECLEIAEKFGLPVGHVMRQVEHEVALRLTAARQDEEGTS